MIARRLALLGGGNVLPNGYTRTEYTELLGNQYYNTEMCMNTSMLIELDYAFNDTETQALFGSRKNAFIEYYSVISSNSYLLAACGNEYRKTDVLVDTSRHKLVYTESGVEFDGMNIINFNASASTDLSMYLGVCNYNGSFYQPARCKIYEFKIYAGEVIVLNYVPCVREADDSRGFYDTVNNRFCEALVIQKKD